MASKALVEMGQQICVLDRGFVYVGHVTMDGDLVTIDNARCIRRWGTTAGLGQLAESGPTAQTKLDVVGTVKAPLRAVIHFVACKTQW